MKPAFEVIRPRDFGDLIQDSIKLPFVDFKNFIRPYLIYLGIPMLILIAIQMYLSPLTEEFFEAMIEALQSGDFEEAFGSLATMNEGNLQLLTSLNGVVSGVFSLLLYIVTFSLIFQLTERPHFEFRNDEVRRDISRLFLPFLGLGILFVVAIMLVMIVAIAIPAGIMAAVESKLMALVLIPAILFVLYFIFSLILGYPIRAFEEIGSYGALKRSWNLIKGYWWQTFGGILVLGILVGIVSAIVTGIFGFLSVSLGTFGSAILALITVLISLVGNIIQTNFLALQYFNIVARKEGATGAAGQSLIDEIGRE